MDQNNPLEYGLRKVTKKDYEFIYEVKKNAYQKYVEANWGLE